MYVLSDKVVITRKEHFCNACQRKFPKGTKMRTQVNTYDGIGTWRECPTCYELLSNHREHFSIDGNICEEDCVNELCDINQTPEELLEYLKNRKT